MILAVVHCEWHSVNRIVELASSVENKSQELRVDMETFSKNLRFHKYSIHVL